MTTRARCAEPGTEAPSCHRAAPARARRLYDRLLRKTAEFDNYRKRVERERKDFTEWAAADVLGELLAVMDDFDRALAAPSAAGGAGLSRPASN